MKKNCRLRTDFQGLNTKANKYSVTTNGGWIISVRADTQERDAETACMQNESKRVVAYGNDLFLKKEWLFEAIR